MMNLTHPDIQNFAEIYTLGWDSKRKKEATFFLKILTDFEFITSIVTLSHLLHTTVSITQKFQGRAVDVIKAFEGVNAYIAVTEYLCESSEDEVSTIYE